jgi:HNH endonuclease
MSSAHISKAIRDQVSREARYRCGYCLSSEGIVGTPMEIDHIIPQSLGASTEQDNLWLACSLCNDHKGDRLVALDIETDQIVRLFDPRHQLWTEHFAWTAGADRMVGLSAIGRATIVALNLNRPSLVRARQAWQSVGWHAPRD